MGCEFTFHVPYTSISPYRYTTGNGRESFGSLAIYAINPLKAPSTVSQTVEVLIEVSGAPDVEFAGLKTNTLVLSSPSAPQSSVKFVRSENEITSGDIGNSELKHDNMISARHCVGERLLSLNSLLRHTDQLVPITQGTTAIAATIDPFSIYTEAYVGIGQSDSPYKSDLYSMITSMFAMSRGAVRYRIFNNATTSVNSTERNRATVQYDNTNNANFGITESATVPTLRRWLLTVIQNQIYRGCVEIQTPPYHHTYARTNVNGFVGSSFLSGNRSFASASKMVISVETSAANGNIYKRQVADDFQCSMFISTPCVRFA